MGGSGGIRHINNHNTVQISTLGGNGMASQKRLNFCLVPD